MQMMQESDKYHAPRVKKSSLIIRLPFLTCFPDVNVIPRNTYIIHASCLDRNLARSFLPMPNSLCGGLVWDSTSFKENKKIQGFLLLEKISMRQVICNRRQSHISTLEGQIISNTFKNTNAQRVSFIREYLQDLGVGRIK